MNDWTVITRKHRGRFMHPVAGVPEGLDWRGAVDVASEIATARPDLEVWYVPTQEAQADSYPEDRDNVLLGDTGRRIPIRWDSTPQATYKEEN